MKKDLVLAITTYNRIDYLKECLESFEQTKCDNNWIVIVADDGSTDGTQEYVESNGYLLIQNNRSGVSNQTNSIFQKLNSIRFDVCFKIDDDITFIKNGWSTEYLDAIEKTGFEHLVYSEKWRCSEHMRSRSMTHVAPDNDILESMCDSIGAMGCFYTITPKILDVVGYFDTLSFGPHESGHVDYTRRCCQAGFNETYTLWDIKDSNDYIHVKQHDDYIPSLEISETLKRRSKYDPYVNIELFKRHSDSRIYCPFNSTTYNVNIPSLSIVIGTYNSHTIKHVLEGFKHQTDKDFELIIINDGGNESDLLSYIRLYSKYLNIKYDILLPKTDAYRLSEARHLGCTLAKGTRIATTDADCIPSPTFVEKHKNAIGIKIGLRNRIYRPIAQSMTKEAITSLNEIPHYHDERCNYWPIIKRSISDAADLAWGCNVSYDFDTLMKVGSFNREYKNWGFEDCDLAYRILQVDDTISIDLDCVVYHLEHPTKCDLSNPDQKANMLRYRSLKRQFNKNTLVL